MNKGIAALLLGLAQVSLIVWKLLYSPDISWWAITFIAWAPFVFLAVGWMYYNFFKALGEGYQKGASGNDNPGDRPSV